MSASVCRMYVSVQSSPPRLTFPQSRKELRFVMYQRLATRAAIFWLETLRAACDSPKLPVREFWTLFRSPGEAGIVFGKTFC